MVPEATHETALHMKTLMICVYSIMVHLCRTSYGSTAYLRITFVRRSLLLWINDYIHSILL